MPNYLQIPVISDMVSDKAYDFGREFRPGDVMMINKTGLKLGNNISQDMYFSNGGTIESISISDCMVDGLSVPLYTDTYSDYVLIVVIDIKHAIAPLCKRVSEKAPTFSPSASSGSIDLNDYNCTAPIVDLQPSGSYNFTAELPDVTELVDGLFFIGKVPANSGNTAIANRKIDVNGLGEKKIYRYDYVTSGNFSVAFPSGHSADTYYPFLYHDNAWYALSESVTSGRFMDK